MTHENNGISLGFGKHYASMYAGSMVGAGAIVFAVMGYVISNQVPSGEDMVVELNPKLLGFVFGEREVDVAKTIEFLCSEDPNSRTKDEGGKRLVRIGQFAYRVVNGRKYREMAKVERKRQLNREAKRREREKQKVVTSGLPLPGENAFVEHGVTLHEHEQTDVGNMINRE